MNFCLVYIVNCDFFLPISIWTGVTCPSSSILECIKFALITSSLANCATFNIDKDIPISSLESIDIWFEAKRQNNKWHTHRQKQKHEELFEFSILFYYELRMRIQIYQTGKCIFIWFAMKQNESISDVFESFAVVTKSEYV